MGARKRCAHEIKAGYEDITPTGYIRHMQLVGTEKDITDVWKTLTSQEIDRSLFNISVKKERLSFASQLWPLIDFSKTRLKISYSHAVFRNGVSYYHPFKKVVLNDGKTLVVEKQTLQAGIWLEGEAVWAFGRLLGIQGASHVNNTQDLQCSEAWDAIMPFEAIDPGLVRYENGTHSRWAGE
jgi:hypothetical protein